MILITSTIIRELRFIKPDHIIHKRALFETHLLNIWNKSFMVKFCLHVITWFYMLLHVISCYYMLLHVFTCYCMLLYVISYYSMLVLVNTCYSMLLHVTACYYMLVHVSTCYCMLLHVITGYCMFLRTVSVGPVMTICLLLTRTVSSLEPLRPEAATSLPGYKMVRWRQTWDSNTRYFTSFTLLMRMCSAREIHHKPCGSCLAPWIDLSHKEGPL